MLRRIVEVGVVVMLGALLIVTRIFRLPSALRVATGFASHTLCSETFVAGVDPGRTVAEIIRPMPGVRHLAPFFRYKVDRERGRTTVSLGGVFAATAVYRQGYGCRLTYDAADRTAAGNNSALREGASVIGGVEPDAVAAANPALAAAIDRAFEGEAGTCPARRAIVVLHDGCVVAERYARGFGVDTPLLGWSVAKSVINALIGILVGEGRISVDGPAPVSAWKEPSDRRRNISVEHLLRMNSGLALDETNTGFDPSSRILYTQPDMAASAERARLLAKPGTRWHYSSPSTLILSRIVRDKIGGHAEEVLAFARRKLFEPAGMRKVTIEFDRTGTPVGSTYIYATARAWARFGLLYMNDGVAGGRRILPQGWVRFSTEPTSGSIEAYGAGFLTNRGEAPGAKLRVEAGMPAGSFMAAGILGQWILIAPAERLVIASFGVSQEWPDFNICGMARLAADVVAATR